ncbi:MAG: helix-turn-helix domain-containing protein [Propionibacterium sp.]
MNTAASVVGTPLVGEPSARRLVLQELLSRGPATVAELAKRLEVTPTAVRRQLAMLLRAGQVEESQHHRRGPRGRGRPAKSYVITGTGRAVFCQGYDDLAMQAMAALVETAGPQAVARLGERRYDDVETKYHERRRTTPDESPVEVLAELLDQKGYVARVDASPLGTQLCQHHCPVADVAAAYPELCETETKVFARLLGSRVQRLATIAHGDGICTMNIPSQNMTSENITPDDPGTHNHREATSA